jgi:hypothetical protein
MMKLLARVPPARSLFVDVGANVGPTRCSAQLARRASPIEPVPWTLELLRANVAPRSGRRGRRRPHPTARGRF